MVRRLGGIALVLAAAAGGCLAASQDPQPAPARADATLLALPACVTQHAPFTVSVTLRDAGGSGGLASISVVAQQYGRIATGSVVLSPGDVRAVALPAVVDTAGAWDVYVTEPHSLAPQETLRVVDAAGRC